MKSVARIVVVSLLLALIAGSAIAAEEKTAPAAAPAAAAPAAVPATLQATLPAVAPVAAPAVAPAFQKTQIVGSWIGFKIADLFSDSGTTDELSVDFLDAGDMVATFATEQKDLSLKLKVIGKWRLDNDLLVQKGVSVSEIEVTPTDDGGNTKQLKKDLEIFKAEQKKKIEQDPEFSKDSPDKILFIDAGFMATKTEKNEIMIFKKK